MATIPFPSNPSVGQVFTYGVKTWKYNAKGAWELQSTSDSQVANAQASAASALASAQAAAASAAAAANSRKRGTFTCAAAITTTVSDTATQATSVILLMPTNAAAATLMGSAKALYVSARTASTSFAVSTASGTAATGTESFEYELLN